jgi:hypothetical protein
MAYGHGVERWVVSYQVVLLEREWGQQWVRRSLGSAHYLGRLLVVWWALLEALSPEAP